jgi:hypothetical protein
MKIVFAPIDAKDNSQTGYNTIGIVDENWERVYPLSAKDLQVLYTAQEEYLSSILKLQTEIKAKYQTQLVGGEPATDAEESEIFNRVCKLRKVGEIYLGLFYT